MNYNSVSQNNFKNISIKILVSSNFLFLLVLLTNINLSTKFKFNKKEKDNSNNNILVKQQTNISFYKYIYSYNNYLINGRITAFINADNIYIRYIPMFCASLLYCDKRNRTDIEIIIDLNKLPEKIEKALDYLRLVYNNSKILIRYNMYHIKNRIAYLQNKRMRGDSIRWFIEPEIKNEYVFIGDIDIMYLYENYYDNYLMDMFNRTSCYSNIVRPNSERLSGVHFSKWYCLYPIIEPKNINLMMNNEELLLMRLKELGVKIDYSTTFRPIFGIHMSVNRPTVESQKRNLTWEAIGKKVLWNKFKQSEIYKNIFPLLDKYIINKIYVLEKYYKYHE